MPRSTYRKTLTMPINESDIEKIAQLAHLEISREEALFFAPQIADIVAYVEQLNEVDTSNVEPALGGLTPEGERTEATRDDVVIPSLGQQLALAEAPAPAAGHFRVPKVL
jgi:aspartyl-tRNA(Asn)/glutamyl-tRNA(Gln) amidotransferase subunit C